MQQTKIYYTNETGRTCNVLLWFMVSSMIWERLELHSILLSNM